METRGRHRLWPRAALAALAACCIVSVAPSTAHAADDYPYRDADPAELDERGFYYRHCTSFAAWRMSLRGEFHNYMLGGHWWHARNWAENAQQIGFAVDTTPAPGAIAHWYAGEQGADELGHVAVVESVHPDGSVTLEEYNGTASLGYSRRGPTHAPRYIHVYDDAPAPVSADVPTEVRAELSRSPVVVPAVERAAASEAIQPKVDEAGGGYLTEPSANARLRSGRKVTVAGRFADDSRIAAVRFFATDNKQRWMPIGTDRHGGNGGYAVRWTVSYPAGSRISFYAEAIDDAGNRTREAIRGLEGIRVIRAAGAPDTDVSGYGRSVTFAGEQSSDGVGMWVLPFLPPMTIFFLSGVSLRRAARRPRMPNRASKEPADLR